MWVSSNGRCSRAPSTEKGILGRKDNSAKHIKVQKSLHSHDLQLAQYAWRVGTPEVGRGGVMNYDPEKIGRGQEVGHLEMPCQVV